MKLTDFDYNLPPELIAQESCKPRDHSRLLVLKRAGGEARGVRIEHRHFFDLPEYLKAGDVLVFNDSKVFPARLRAVKAETGGEVEILLLREAPRCPDGRRGSGSLAMLGRRGGVQKGARGLIWEAIIGGKGKKGGLELVILDKKGARTKARVILKKPVEDMIWEIEFGKEVGDVWALAQRYGKAPTPPYVKKITDLKKYQTVYAEKTGSVAAPTAGFHFTPRLLKKLRAKGVQCEFVTLHVGPGTFAPIRETDILKHKMHSEWTEISAAVVGRLNLAKKEGRRIIAVGTTAARTLEAAGQSGKIKAGSAWTDIFIYPGYKFKVLDGLVTNFHLPKSSLLVLVSALAGRELILRAYAEAVREKYRFYSFGDGMVIL